MKHTVLTPPLSPSEIAIQTGKLFDLRMEAGKAAQEVFPPSRNTNGEPISNPHFAAAYDFELAKRARRAGLFHALTQRERERLLGQQGEAA